VEGLRQYNQGGSFRGLVTLEFKNTWSCTSTPMYLCKARSIARLF
jgi:hypothetical protein